MLTVDAGGLATFMDCTFVNNTAPTGDGGVAHVHPNGSVVFTSCSFVNNSASAGGGAVDVYKGSARFDNCTFEEDRAGTDLRFNGVYNGGSVVFGCPTGTTGAVVKLYGNANTTQLPPAKQIVSCHPSPASFKALQVDDSAATTDVADPAAAFVFGQDQETLQPARPVKSDDESAPPPSTDRFGMAIVPAALSSNPQSVREKHDDVAVPPHKLSQHRRRAFRGRLTVSTTMTVAGMMGVTTAIGSSCAGRIGHN